MNTAAAISRAALPDPHTICGVTLRPFSIGAWLHLTRCEISFAVGGEHTHGDLLLGVLICSQTYENFAGSLTRDGDIERAMSLLARRLSGGALGTWRRRLKRWRGEIVRPEEIIGFDFLAECRAFERYIAEHGGSGFRTNEWARPVTAFQQAQEPREMNAPELLVLLDLLTSELGLEKHEALNIPLPQARWDWAVHAERKGWVRIVDGAEMKEMRADKDAANEWARKVMAREVVL